MRTTLHNRSGSNILSANINFDVKYFLGYSSHCYDPLTKKIKRMSMSIHLSHRQFVQYLQELFPKLTNDFMIFVIDVGGNFKEIQLNSPMDIKALNYSGTIVLANKHELPAKYIPMNSSATSTSTSMPSIDLSSTFSTPPANSNIFNDNLVSTSTEISTARVSVGPVNRTTSRIPSFTQVRGNLSRNPASLASESPTRIPFVPVRTSSTPIYFSPVINTTFPRMSFPPFSASSTRFSAATINVNTPINSVSPVSANSTGISFVHAPVSLGIASLIRSNNNIANNLTSTRVSAQPVSTNNDMLIIRNQSADSAVSSRRSKLLTIYVKFGDEQPLTFQFIDTTKPFIVYESVQNIYTSLKGKDFLLIKEDNPDNQLSRNSNLDLFHWMVKSGTIYIVNVFDDSTSSSSADDIDIVDMPSIACQKSSVVHARRLRLLATIHETQELYIRRDHLMFDAMEQFHDFGTIKKLYVKFADENGLDLDGLTRGFFADFWSDFLKIFGFGNDQLYLNIDPNNLLKPYQCKAAGSILVHGLVLTGYVPYYLNQAVLYKLVCQLEPSQSLINNSFFSCLDQRDRHLLESAESMESFDNETKLQLATMLSGHDFLGMPTPSSIKSMINNLTNYVTLVKPFYLIHHLQSGVLEADCNPLKGSSESEFIKYITSIKPTGIDIVRNLDPNYSDDANIQAAEERSFGYLETFVSSLNDRI